MSNRGVSPSRVRAYNDIHDLKSLTLSAAEPSDIVRSHDELAHTITDAEKHQRFSDHVKHPFSPEQEKTEAATLFFKELESSKLHQDPSTEGMLPATNWEFMRANLTVLENAFVKHQMHFSDLDWDVQEAIIKDGGGRDCAPPLSDYARECMPEQVMPNGERPGEFYPRSRILETKRGAVDRAQWKPPQREEVPITPATQFDTDVRATYPSRLTGWLQGQIEAAHPSIKKKTGGAEGSDEEGEEAPNSDEDEDTKAYREEMRKERLDRATAFPCRDLQHYRPDLFTMDSETGPILAQNQFQAPKSAEPLAFLAHDVLTSAECGYLMRAAHPLLEPLDAHFEQRYRYSERAMIRSETVADELFRRLLRVLKPEDYKDRIPLCFSQDGQWLPLACNECLKVVRYGPGGKFAMHRDAPWIPSPDQASLFTVIVYLNEDFYGGGTSLESHPCGPRGLRDSYESDAAIVLPCAGSALVFNHDQWHGGLPVVRGAKWILRTEMVFQRVRTHYVDRYIHADDDAFLATKKLYEESITALKEGRRAEFAETYQRVIVAQQRAMLDTALESSRQGRLLSRLSDDEFGVILDYLPDIAIAQGVLSVNKATYYATVQAAAAWERRCAAAFPSWVSPVSAAVLKSTKGTEVPTNVTESDSLHADWFGLYVGRRTLTRRFCPAVLSLCTSSLYVAHHSGAAPSLQYGPVFYSVEEATGPAAVKIDDGGLATWIDGYYRFFHEDPFHMNVPPCDRYVFRDYSERPQDVMDAEENAIPEISASDLPEPSAEYPEEQEEDEENVDVPGSSGRDKIHTICKPDGSVSWSILAPRVLSVIGTTWMPLLIVGHPAMFVGTSDVVENRLERHRRDAFLLLRTPALVILHPALAALSAAAPKDSTALGSGRTLVAFRLSLKEVYLSIVNCESHTVESTICHGADCDSSRPSSFNDESIGEVILVEAAPLFRRNPLDDDEDEDDEDEDEDEEEKPSSKPIEEAIKESVADALKQMPESSMKWGDEALSGLRSERLATLPRRELNIMDVLESAFRTSRSKDFRNLCVFNNNGV